MAGKYGYAVSAQKLAGARKFAQQREMTGKKGRRSLTSRLAELLLDRYGRKQSPGTVARTAPHMPTGRGLGGNSMIRQPNPPKYKI